MKATLFNEIEINIENSRELNFLYNTLETIKTLDNNNVYKALYEINGNLHSMYLLNMVNVPCNLSLDGVYSDFCGFILWVGNIGHYLDNNTIKLFCMKAEEELKNINQN